MKFMKIKLYLLTLFLALGSLMCSAQDDAKDATKRTKAEIKTALSEKVQRLDNGDVIIAPPPKPEVSLREISDIPFSLIYLLCYVDENSDFQKFAKIINSKAKRDADGSRPIDSLMEGVSAYFATQNLNFAKLNFSANNVRQKIDNGLPVFGWFQASNFYETVILSRTKERPSEGDMKEWVTALRKSGVKDFPKTIYRDNGLIVGYNKTTNEYLVIFPQAKVWLTENEMKKAINSLFQLRL